MQNGLKNSGLPLGGLGTGSVEIREDGYLHEWQVMNNDPWGSGEPFNSPRETSYFGLQVKGKKTNRSTILGEPGGYNSYLNNPYHQPWVEHPEEILSDIRMPFTNLEYKWKSFPVSVTLEAFSPFIPLDTKNSALPIAFFSFSIKNNTNETLKVSLFNAMQNLVGYSKQDKSSKMTFSSDAKSSQVLFERENMDKDDSSAGSMVMGAFYKDKIKPSYVFHQATSREIWDPIRKETQLENIDHGNQRYNIGDVGEEEILDLRKGLPYGVLALTFDLKPKQTTNITFVLSWHFPNMKEEDNCGKNKQGTLIGHMYENWFANAKEAADYGIKNYSNLRIETKKFFDEFYKSSFEPWLLDAISAQLTTLIKSSWWDKKGRFGIWEGLGCCGLQTTDITYYASFPIVLFFPEIQKSQMKLSKSNIEGKGKVPHLMPGNFCSCNVDLRNRIDLIPEYILLIWRDILWTGDKEYALEMWQSIKDALEYSKTFDTDGDGLPNNTGPDQTYDQFPLKGTSSFVGFIYAASLKAVSEIAMFLGETDYAQSISKQCTDALIKLDKQLWNGKYYRLSHDPANKKNNEGVMTDQINGGWFVRQAAGEALIDEKKERSALTNIIKHNTKETNFIANCSWPSGDAVEIGRHTSDQANTPWSGVEYAFAAHLILAGMEKEAINVVKGVWDRYEKIGLRFNHIECGQHYYRALSSWAIYLALTGFSINSIKESITIGIREKEVFYVINTPTSYGTVNIKANKVEISIIRGCIALKEIELKNTSSKKVSVKSSGKKIETSTQKLKNKTIVTFKQTLKLGEGDGIILVV